MSADARRAAAAAGHRRPRHRRLLRGRRPRRAGHPHVQRLRRRAARARSPTATAAGAGTPAGRPVAGTGRLYSWTVVAHQVHPAYPGALHGGARRARRPPRGAARRPAARPARRSPPASRWRSGSSALSDDVVLPQWRPVTDPRRSLTDGLRRRPRVPGGPRLGRRLRARGGRAARPGAQPRVGHERPAADGADPAAAGAGPRARACGRPTSAPSSAGPATAR